MQSRNLEQLSYTAHQLILIYTKRKFDDLHAILHDKDIKKDVNIYLPSGKSLLEDSLDCKDEETAELLIKAGADPNIETAGKTPLIEKYILEKNFDAAIFLLNHDANPNIEKADSGSPLRVAVIEGHVPLLKALLKCNDLEVGPKPKKDELTSKERDKLIFIVSQKFDAGILFELVSKIPDQAQRDYAMVTAFRAFAASEKDPNPEQDRENKFKSMNAFFAVCTQTVDAKQLCKTALSTFEGSRGLKSSGHKLEYAETFIAFFQDKQSEISR